MAGLTSVYLSEDEEGEVGNLEYECKSAHCRNALVSPFRPPFCQYRRQRPNHESSKGIDHPADEVDIFIPLDRVLGARQEVDDQDSSVEYRGEGEGAQEGEYETASRGDYTDFDRSDPGKFIARVARCSG